MRRFFLATASLSFMACEVSLDDIEKWKGTERGPLKIRTALSDEGQAKEVRHAAAAAMAEIDLLTDLDEDMKFMPPEEQKMIADGAIGLLLGRIRSSTPGAPPTPAQVRAKDGVFTLRSYASDAVRAQADGSLVLWLTADLPGRMLQGAHSGEKMILAIGSSAGPALADSLTPEAADLVEAATLLRKVGDATSREQGGEKLIQIARAQPERTEQIFLAMGRLGGKRIAQHLNAAAARSGEPRVRLLALRALQLVADPSSISTARAIAADSRLTDELALLRDEALGVLQAIGRGGNMLARDALLGFLGDRDEKVRWAAVDAICSTQREDFVAVMLELLPASLVEKPEDLRDFLEERIRKELGPKIVPSLRKLALSSNWVSRLLAVRLLGDLGSDQDLAVLERLAREDDTPVRGWSGATVGSEARSAAGRLSGRVKKRG